MTALVVEVCLILVLLAMNGVFAMTEIAVVPARRARRHRLAETGDLKPRAALEIPCSRLVVRPAEGAAK